MTSHPVTDTVTMHHLRSGITLAVRNSGPADGHPVVMLHGFPETGATWKPLADLLAAEDVRTVAPDLRGFGLSDAPRGVGAYRLDRLVGDVAELLESFCAPVDVVGHDWGGVLLWLVVERRPDVIRSATILNAPHPLVLRRAVFRDRDQRARSRYILRFQPPWLPERRLRSDDGVSLARFFSDTHSTEEVDAYRACWRRPNVLHGMVNWYRALVQRPGHSPDLPDAARDVLLITGDRDTLFTSEVLERSVQRIDAVRWLRLADAGHSPHRHDPEQIAHLLIDRLATRE